MISKKQIIIISVALFAILVIAAIIFAIYTTTMSSLLVLSNPRDAQIIVDGKNHRSGDRLTLSAGDHHVSISRKGFADKTEVIKTEPGKTSEKLFILDVSGPEGDQYLKDHPDEVYEREGVAGADYSEFVDELTDANPAIALLPVYDLGYIISYGVSNRPDAKPSDVAIYIQAQDEKARLNALDWFYANGFNPDDYEIIYKEAN